MGTRWRRSSGGRGGQWVDRKGRRTRWGGGSWREEGGWGGGDRRRWISLGVGAGGVCEGGGDGGFWGMRSRGGIRAPGGGSWAETEGIGGEGFRWERRRASPRGGSEVPRWDRLRNGAMRRLTEREVARTRRAGVRGRMRRNPRRGSPRAASRGHRRLRRADAVRARKRNPVRLSFGASRVGSVCGARRGADGIRGGDAGFGPALPFGAGLRRGKHFTVGSARGIAAPKRARPACSMRVSRRVPSSAAKAVRPSGAERWGRGQ